VYIVAAWYTRATTLCFTYSLNLASARIVPSFVACGVHQAPTSRVCRSKALKHSDQARTKLSFTQPARLTWIARLVWTLYQQLGRFPGRIGYQAPELVESVHVLKYNKLGFTINDKCGPGLDKRGVSVVCPLPIVRMTPSHPQPRNNPHPTCDLIWVKGIA
jgi:hypothetical protein